MEGENDTLAGGEELLAGEDTLETAAAETAEAETNEDAGDKSASDEGDKPEDEGNEDDSERRPSGSKKAKRKIERLQQEIAALRASQAAPADANLDSEVSKRVGEPPKEADFQDYFEFLTAKAAFDARKAITADLVKQQQQSAEQSQQARLRHLTQEHDERIKESRKALPDWDDVFKKAAARQANMPMHVIEAVLESDKSDLVAYHIAKNADLEAELASMSPTQAARKIGQLEARLSLPKPKSATSAPAPARPLKGAATPAKSPADMTMEEYVAWSNAEDKKRGSL